ncbi:MAG: hypothetical protein V1647_00005, partial [Pseudomonadota bacterium]
MRFSSLLLVIIVVMPSCSNYMTGEQGFFSKFQNGRFIQAADSIKEKSEKEGKDQILYLLDRGTALFEGGDYKQAIDVFTQAERLTETKDVTSINEEVVSVVTTDKFKRFYPMDYELIMINFYLMLSYYMEQKYDDALVECRRINNLVYKLKTKGMKDFEENPVAWYISATIYEMRHKYTDALIDYKRAVKLSPNFTQGFYDVYRMARFTNNTNVSSTLEKEHRELKLPEYYEKLCKKCGTVVILYANGQIPIKRQDPYNDMLPKFYTRTFSVSPLTVLNAEGEKITESKQILDLETVARKNLSERIGRIMAKRILGIGTQVAIGYGVAKATNNDALG